MNRLDRPRQVLALAIAFLAGGVDAVGFLSADGYFVSFMSGNTTRLAALAGPVAQPVAPIYIDLPALGEGALPQGGETVVSFPNNHLGYAITWFGFATLVPFLLFFWVRRQRAPKQPKP